MSVETYNAWAICLGAATLAALLAYTYFTFRLLVATQATAKSTQSELEVMQNQLTLAQQTADSTRKELDILQEQLATARRAIEVQQEREDRMARPVLVWKGGHIDGSPSPSCRVEFQNQGGSIAIIETRALHCVMSLSPANYIPKNGEGRFSLGYYDPTTVRYFGMKYLTGTNEVRTTVFRIEVDAPISPRVESGVTFEQMDRMPPPPQPVEIL